MCEPFWYGRPVSVFIAFSLSVPRWGSLCQRLFYIFFSPKKRTQGKLLFDKWFKTDNILSFLNSRLLWCYPRPPCSDLRALGRGQVLTFSSVFLSINTHGGEPLQLLPHDEVSGSRLSRSLPHAPSSSHEPAQILSCWQETCTPWKPHGRVKNVKMSK